jgi:hypothetical protein
MPSSSKDDFGSSISLEVINEEAFNKHYTGCMVDDITGLMLLKRVAKNENSDTSVKALLNKREKVFIHESHSIEDIQEWKSFIKTSMRYATRRLRHLFWISFLHCHDLILQRRDLK